jgi:hypothetical protein
MFLVNINQFIFEMVKCCVFFEVRTKFLTIIWMRFGFKGLIVTFWEFPMSIELSIQLWKLQDVQRQNIAEIRRFWPYILAFSVESKK